MKNFGCLTAAMIAIAQESTDKYFCNYSFRNYSKFNAKDIDKSRKKMRKTSNKK